MVVLGTVIQSWLQELPGHGREFSAVPAVASSFSTNSDNKPSHSFRHTNQKELQQNTNKRVRCAGSELYSSVGKSEQQCKLNVMNNSFDPISEDGKDHEPDYLPHLNWNMVIIVAAVIQNEDGKIAMIQEAKRSAYGEWYLPAGKIEPNGETIIEGVKREVLEESGLEFEPSHLALVEVQGTQWIRFTFIGKMVGGNLKTIKEADEESLQAAWLSIAELTEGKVKIRARDCIRVIQQAIKFKQSSQAGIQVLPLEKTYARIYTKLLLVCLDGEELSALAFRNCDNVFYLPAILVNLQAHSSDISTTIKSLFGVCNDIRQIGVVNVEFCQTEHKYGFAMTILYKLQQKHALNAKVTNATWITVDHQQLKNDVKTILQHPEVCPLYTDIWACP